MKKGDKIRLVVKGDRVNRAWDDIWSALDWNRLTDGCVYEVLCADKSSVELMCNGSSGLVGWWVVNDHCESIGLETDTLSIEADAIVEELMKNYA